MDKSTRIADEHPTDELADKGRADYTLEEKDDEKGFETSLKLKLSPDREKVIATEIIDLADQFNIDRDDWLKQWKEVRMWYEDEIPDKDLPWPGCSNYHDPLILKAVNGISARVSQVIWGNGERKLWTFKPLKKAKIESCRRKEKFLDYVTVTEMKLEQVFNFAKHDAVLLGNGFIALNWLTDEKRVKDVEIYDPANDVEIMKLNAEKGKDEKPELTALEMFKENYLDVETEYPEYVKRLENGERLELNVSYNDKVYDAPKAEWVKPEDMIADKKIIEPERQVCYGRWRHFTKNELLALGKSKYFKNIDELFKADEKDKDGKKADTDLYDVAEVTYYIDTDKDGIAEPNKFWIEKDKKLFLRGIAYPYDHMKPDIIPIYFENKGDEFYRKGCGIRLMGMNSSIDTVIQQALDSNAANFPVFAEDDDYNPQLWQFSPLCTVPKGLKQINLQMSNMIQDDIGLAQLLARKGDDVSGLSSLTTGRESQTDPNAPGSKTAMLLRESGINLGEGIKTIKLCMREIGFQISELEYQFGNRAKEFRVLGTEAFEEISADDMRIRGEYGIAGSLEYADPNVVFQKNKFLYEYGSKNPIVQSNPVIQAELWRNLVISTGDIWEMQVDVLAPTPVESLEMMDTFKQDIAEKQREIAERNFKAKALRRGKTPEEAEIIKAGLFNNQTPQEEPVPPLPAEGVPSEPIGIDTTGETIPQIAE